MKSTFIVNFPGLGIENLEINRIAFSVFGMPVYWYGLLISFAVILSLFLAQRDSKKFGVLPDTVTDTIMVIVPFMLIFARLYYVIFALDEFEGDFLKIFNLRTGWLAFYGGVIGGIVAILIVSRWRKVPLWRLTDLLAVYLPLAQGIGRWGNFFNQEAFGTNTDLPWGMISEGTASYLRITGTGDPTLPVHPTFLYEFLGNLLIFVILIYVRKMSKRPFETTMAYFVLYGTLRFFVESIRTDALFIGNTSIRVSMLLSGIMVIGGAAVWIFIRRQPIVPGKAGLVETSIEDNENIDNKDTDNENTDNENTDNEDTNNEDTDNENIDNKDTDNENTDNEDTDNGNIDNEDEDIEGRLK